MTHKEANELSQLFEIARECTPAGKALRKAYAELHAEIHKPAFIRKRDGQWRTPGMMADCRLLEDEADRQAARIVFDTTTN